MWCFPGLAHQIFNKTIVWEFHFPRLDQEMEKPSTVNDNDRIIKQCSLDSGLWQSCFEKPNRTVDGRMLSGNNCGTQVATCSLASSKPIKKSSSSILPSRPWQWIHIFLITESICRPLRRPCYVDKNQQSRCDEVQLHLQRQRSSVSGNHPVPVCEWTQPCVSHTVYMVSSLSILEGQVSFECEHRVWRRHLFRLVWDKF